MEIQSYARQIKFTYRRVSRRVVRAFRTVSYAALYVITDMPPIELVTEKRAKVYQRLQGGRDVNRRVVAKEEQATTTEQ